MNISKALKKISRLKGKIGELQRRIQSSMCTLAENEFDEEILELIEERDRVVSELGQLKVNVMKANVEFDIFAKILHLAELKASKEFIGSLAIVVGKVSRRFEAGHDDYKSQISKKEKNMMLQKIAAEIEKVIDELDEFNATHEV